MSQAGTITLIIGGGIAAYKSLELIRLCRKSGYRVIPVMTSSAGEFVTSMSVQALSGSHVYQELFSLTDESAMGHIELSRQADLVVIAPATADLMAKAAQGLANDLASTLLLATDAPVLMAPAMNVRMWEHPATQRNLTTLRQDGVQFVGPDQGEMACGETGPGRMAEPGVILDAIAQHLAHGPLTGKRVLVTSGPTHEPIDPVRYIANRSSGAQGTAIARELIRQGAEVVFVSGPALVPPPDRAEVIRVETAQEMANAALAQLPVDIAICAAAVADWHIANASEQKVKKTKTGMPILEFSENPDILALISHHKTARPGLVVGFAAETEDVIDHATAKRDRKGCDWILANDVSPATGIMGGTENAITLITATGADVWPRLRKEDAARRLVQKIVDAGLT